MPNYVSSQQLRQLTFFSLLVFLFIFLFLQISSFLPALLGAITLYVLLQKKMHWLVNERKWNSKVAAGILLLLSFLVVLVPTWIMANMISSRLAGVIRNSEQVVAVINKTLHFIELKLHLKLPDPDEGGINKTVTSSLPRVLGATFNTVTSIVIMYFVLYFMLVSTKSMEKWLHEYIPLKQHNVDLVAHEMRTLVISNALGIPLVAALQGLVALACYVFLRVPDVWFWFLFTCVASMLPFVGAALAYVPLSLVLFSRGENWKGIILLIYGIAIIGSVDNIFRFVLQKKLGNIHPLITVFGVIIGINLFGFIGLVFGPILISMFILLVKIYMNEFVKDSTPSEEQLKA